MGLTSIAERVAARFRRAGGDSFSNFVPLSDVKAAFREAQEEAGHEHGHGGYSGTIAEKGGYEVRKTTPMSRDEAHRFIDTDIEKNDKWGPAFAVPIGETVKHSEEKFKVKVTAKDEWSAQEAAVKTVRETYPGAPGVSAVVKPGRATLLKQGKLPDMTVEKGGPEGFKVVGPGTSVVRDGWERGKVFASRAEALAAFKGTVSQMKPESGVKYTIVKFKTSDTFTIGDTTKSMHLFEVEGTVTVEKSTGKTIGWLFYGIASS